MPSSAQIALRGHSVKDEGDGQKDSNDILLRIQVDSEPFSPN